MCMGHTRVYGELWNVWGALENIGGIRMYSTPQSVSGPLEYMEPFSVYGAL